MKGLFSEKIWKLEIDGLLPKKRKKEKNRTRNKTFNTHAHTHIHTCTYIHTQMAGQKQFLASEKTVGSRLKVSK